MQLTQIYRVDNIAIILYGSSFSLQMTLCAQGFALCYGFRYGMGWGLNACAIDSGYVAFVRDRLVTASTIRIKLGIGL